MGMRVQSDGDLNGEDAVLKLKASVQDLLEVLGNFLTYFYICKIYVLVGCTRV